MTHPAYILVDAEGKVIAVSESRDGLSEKAFEITLRGGFPIILPAEVKWEMPKDQQI